MTKVKNSNCDKTWQLKLWQNSKNQIVTKLKISNCDNTQKLKLGKTSKTQIVTKLKNSNSDKTQILKLCQNSNCDKTQKLKLWQNSKTQIVTKLKISNCDKTQKVVIGTTWHLNNRWDVLGAAFCDSCNVSLQDQRLYVYIFKMCEIAKNINIDQIRAQSSKNITNENMPPHMTNTTNTTYNRRRKNITIFFAQV